MQHIFIYIFAILYYCSISRSSAAISPCARWNPNGITVAGNGTPGDGLTQLALPTGIFLMKRTKTLYVTDFGNERVQMFSLNQPSSPPTTVISNLRAASKIYVDDDKDGPTIYISVWYQNRLEKWTKGALEGIELVDECRSCFGVAVDEEKNVFVAESGRHRLMKWSPRTNLTTIVAGQTDERGTTDEYLSEPKGIYFDQSSEALYVADSENNRIQKWNKNALSGIQVAGANISYPGGDNGSLDEPDGVWVDEYTKVIYVADTLNNRIARWLPDALVGDIIAGGQGQGNAANQFNTPSDLTFDSEGNLYVCDNWNHRIQMFSIIDNEPCSPTSTGKSEAFCLYHDRPNEWLVTTIMLSILTWIIGELF